MTIGVTLGLRERKKADTRRALSDAALTLALEQGFEAVTREAIAARAGVSLRTFNNYFTGKYEALAYWQAERTRRSISALRERPIDEPLWTSITEVVMEPLEADFGDAGRHESGASSHAELGEVRKLLMSTDIRNAVARELFDDWVQVIADRTGTDPVRDMYPRLVVAVVRAVSDVAMDVYGAADPPIAITVLLRQGIAAVVAGLPEPSAKEKDHA